MRIFLSKTLSYCFGVKKTLSIVEELLAKKDGNRYYMLGEVVHNEHVIRKLTQQGLNIVSSLDEVPEGGIVILQSHGTPVSLYQELEQRKIRYVDATCPMVRNIHIRIKQLVQQGYTPVIIGKKGHDEVRGIEGQVGQSIIIKGIEEATPELFAGIRRAGIVVQSTFQTQKAEEIVKKIRTLVPDVLYHDTICQPTKTRQKEIEENSKLYDCNIIIGSRNSSNTMHLYQIALANNPCTYLVDNLESARNLSIPSGSSVFIASGASTPEDLIEQIIAILQGKTEGGPACNAPRN
jgi:4-hydroxy-3-methylbut-2-enyl diphosphate reductase